MRGGEGPPKERAADVRKKQVSRDKKTAGSRTGRDRIKQGLVRDEFGSVWRGSGMALRSGMAGSRV